MPAELSSPDPFAQWQAQVLSGRSERWKAERDLSFWMQGAQRYDQYQPPLPNTAAWLREQLRGAGSLLEVGAGTGRLLLPLAGAVAHVTALDYSPEMLAKLKAKNPPAHVTLRCQSLAEAAADPALRPHGAVLSAWSLAYQPDLRAALNSLLKLANRSLYLLEDDGVGSPHVNLRRTLAAQPRPQRASLLRECLRALGQPAQLQRIPEKRELNFPDPQSLLAFVRLPLPDAEIWRELAPYVTETSAGLRYVWTFDVHALSVQVGESL